MNPVEREIFEDISVSHRKTVSWSIMAPSATLADIRGVLARIRISVQAIFCHVLRN